MAEDAAPAAILETQLGEWLIEVGENLLELALARRGGKQPVGLRLVEGA